MTVMEQMKDGSIRCRWMYNHCNIMSLPKPEGFAGGLGYKKATIR